MNIHSSSVIIIIIVLLSHDFVLHDNCVKGNNICIVDVKGNNICIVDVKGNNIKFIYEIPRKSIFFTNLTRLKNKNPPSVSAYKGMILTREILLVDD